MNLKIYPENIKLFLFSIFTTLVTYGFGLTNYSLSVDSETPVYPDFSLGLGRWGTNLVRYQIFEGHVPYFTLLLGLVLLSLTAVELTKLFKYNGTAAYVFCALFLSFPQLSYQLIFTMQADVVPLGFLCSVLAVNIFLKCTDDIFSAQSIGLFILSSLLIMFVISIYQALIFIPVIIYIIHFMQNTFLEDFQIKLEIRKGLHYGVLLILSVVLYYVSVKLLCPPVEGGYLSSYLSGESNNLVSNFYSLWIENLKGKAYYGERLVVLMSILAIALVIKFGIDKKLFIYRFISLFLLLVLPYFISFFITNGYNPPRIYVTSGIVFAFIIVHFFRNIKSEKILVLLCSLICLTHVYFITQLFYSNYKIFNHDKDIARKIDLTIQSKYPEFDPAVNYIYFQGCLPYEHHDKFRLPNSEIFGGSLFSWDNGDNYRIINFFRFNDIAYYKMIDDKEIYFKIRDSINQMPVWPKSESVKMINNVMVVKLGKEKGAPLHAESR